MFHFVDHAREILVAIDRSSSGKDLMSRRSRRHRHAKFGGLVENQSEVFAHEPQRKLRRIVIALGAKKFVLMRSRDHCGLGEYSEQQRAAQARAFIEGRDFCLPDDFKQLVLPVFAHRLVVNARYATTQKKTVQAETILTEMIESTPVPL